MEMNNSSSTPFKFFKALSQEWAKSWKLSLQRASLNCKLSLQIYPFPSLQRARTCSHLEKWPRQKAWTTDLEGILMNCLTLICSASSKLDPISVRQSKNVCDVLCAMFWANYNNSSHLFRAYYVPGLGWVLYVNNTQINLHSNLMK